MTVTVREKGAGFELAIGPAVWGYRVWLDGAEWNPNAVQALKRILEEALRRHLESILSAVEQALHLTFEEAPIVPKARMDFIREEVDIALA